MTAVSPLPAPSATTARALNEAGLLDLWDKIAAGERLDAADGLRLFEHPQLPLVGWMANRVREATHGDRCWFNRNLHINATNVCEASCIFCSFARLETGDPNAWTMSFEQALERIRVLEDELVTEVHIVNGLNPDLPFDYYTDLMKRLKAERPELHVKGFTAVEIHYYREKYGMSTEAVLERFIDAGLGSMPGGGAEIFAERARRKLCHDKVDSPGWLDIHRTAHRMGLRTNATMLFGSIETLEERVDHLLRLRATQDRSLADAAADPAHQGGRFVTFIPLRFHNDHNRLAALASPTGFDSLRTIAVSRLLLDNFDHIKAYWPMLGTDEAQVALHFGSSDLDGTVREEHIYHMAGADTPQGLSRSELVRFIEHAGRIPAERDTVYNVIRRCDAAPALDSPAATPDAPPTLGWVDYSNARPLVAGLDGVTLKGGHPSEVARWLADGTVGLALLPVGALLSDPAAAAWRVVPDVCIGCEGAVDSVLIAAETPPEQWTRVLLDGVSRTSVILARLLLQHGPLRDRVRPDLELVEVAPGAGVDQARGAVATVVIGDAALQRPARLAHTLDLGAEWTAWTGLPFVFAVWAGRPDLDPRVVERVRAAGLRGLRGVADGSLLVDATPAERTYLRDRIRYPLDDRATMGLLRFAALAKRAGLVARETVSLYDPPLSQPATGPGVAALLDRALAGEALPADAVRRLLTDAPLGDLLIAADLRRAALHPGDARTYTTDDDASLALRYGGDEDADALARRLVDLRTNRRLDCVSVESVPEAGTLVGRRNNTAVMGLRLLAVARLALPDVPHVQASWRQHGRGIAQLAQHAGADDFGAVLPPDEQAEMVDGVWPMTVREAERSLRLAGLSPQRRDGDHAPVGGPVSSPDRAGRPLRRLVPPTPGK